jgi:nicotinamide-nucleotide amidase
MADIIDSNTSIQPLLRRLSLLALSGGHRIATAESCTGGLIATLCTSIAGSSDWFDCGMVVYSNTAKQRLLGVATESLQHYGPISEIVACQMALGVLGHSVADLSVAVTGIAGPTGDDIGTPVGTVWLAWTRRLDDIAMPEIQRTRHSVFAGDRTDIRQQAAITALEGLIEVMG